MIKYLKIIKMNKKESMRRYYKDKKNSCITCKYFYIHRDIFSTISGYECFLREPDFDNINRRHEYEDFVCSNYKPTRKFKKYLEGKYDTKKSIV